MADGVEEFIPGSNIKEKKLITELIDLMGNEET
jgi:hypothetical protein